MDQLSRFDIAEHGGLLMVVIESELLPPDPAVVVVPLIKGYPAIQYLNPEIAVNGGSFICATRLIASVRRASLKRIGTAEDQGDEIIRAIDILLSGV